MTEPGTVTMVDRRWRTELAVTLRGEGAAAVAGPARATFRAEVERLERAASRFRRDSELSAANDRAGRWVPASPLLVELVRVALAAAEATDGLVNPCLGAFVDAAGYRSWAAGEVSGPIRVVPVGEVDPSAWQRLEVGPDRVRVPAGTVLDLGATAKAWLADEVAERLADQCGVDVLAAMGGDLRAIGAHGPWLVGVDHAVSGVPVESLAITDAGLATSGQGGRRWLTTGGPAHHIIDPRTGTSALTRWWAVSVHAASATAANTAATAALLLDGEGPGWLADRGVDAALTSWLGGGPALRRRVGRWPARTEEAA